MATKTGTVISVDGTGDDAVAVVEADGNRVKIKAKYWNAGYAPADGDGVEFEDERGTRKNLRPVGVEARRVVRLDNVELLEHQAKPGYTRVFRNPKNFVATPTRPAPGTTLGDLGDSTQGVWHHRGHAGRLHGTMTVSATVLTDLIINDSPRRTVDPQNKHQTHPLRMHGDRALLPATTLKGAVRSAVEAITNSRMSVFTATKRLGSRTRADGSQLVPTRVEAGPDGSLRLRLLPGAAPIGAKADHNQPLHAAWVDADAVGALHGTRVEVTLSRWRHRRGFTVLRAESVTVEGRALPRVQRQHGSLTKVGNETITVSGWVAASGKIAQGKHDERIFFHRNPDNSVVVDLTGDLKAQWRDLLENFRTVNKRALEKNTPSPGGDWGRHITRTDRENLADGDLVYARVRVQAGGTPQVVALFPVQLSRELDDVAPIDLLDPSLHPAATLTDLSPADVMFGWVAQQKTTPAALRGRIAIDDALIDRKHIETGKRTLAILSSPKPEQARFYLGLKRDRDDVTIPFPDGEDARSVRYDRATTTVRSGGKDVALSKRLRGRAVYVRHDRLDEPEWKRTGDTADDQNRTVTSWVKQGAEFTFDVHIRDLEPWQLGALLFVLDGASDERDLNLGFGKPLGFGSLSLRVTSASLRTTEQLTDWLLDPGTDADGPLYKDALGDAAQAFHDASKLAFGRDFDSIPHIVAWRAARRSGALPVRYPRASSTPHPDGRNYEWFTSRSGNEKVERGQSRHGLSLPDLRNDIGLPYFGE